MLKRASGSTYATDDRLTHLKGAMEKIETLPIYAKLYLFTL